MFFYFFPCIIDLAETSSIMFNDSIGVDILALFLIGGEIFYC